MDSPYPLLDILTVSDRCKEKKKKKKKKKKKGVRGKGFVVTVGMKKIARRDFSNFLAYWNFFCGAAKKKKKYPLASN